MQLVNNNGLSHSPTLTPTMTRAAISCSFLFGMPVKREMDITPLRKMKIMLFLALLKKNFIFAFITNARGCLSKAELILLILAISIKTELGSVVG